jgi:hypothetical protein
MRPEPSVELVDVQDDDAVPGVAGELAGHLDGRGHVARRMIARHVHREDDGFVP